MAVYTYSVHFVCLSWKKDSDYISNDLWQPWKICTIAKKRYVTVTINRISNQMKTKTLMYKTTRHSFLFFFLLIAQAQRAIDCVTVTNSITKLLRNNDV